MALANENHHPNADCDVQHDPLQLKQQNNHLNEEHSVKKRVTFDKNLICSDSNGKSAEANGPVNEDDFELPDHVVYKLYLNRLLSAFADRTWDFATGLFVIKLWPESLFLAGVQGILTAISLIVISPMIGKWIEKAERLFETKICLIVQNSCVIFGGLFVCFYFAHLENPQTGLMEELAEWAPYAFVFFSLMSAVFGSAYTLLLEKDWVLALAPDEDKLTNLNAMLRRIDLCMLTISSFVCGILMQYSDFGTAVFLCLFNFFSGFCEYFLLRSVYYTGPAALREEKQFGGQSFKDEVHKIENSILKSEVPPTSSTEELSESIFDINTLKLYKDTFLLPGLSFGLMFLTVLGFDSITVGYLTHEKLEDRTVGFVALLAGLFGIAATLLYPALVNRFGVLKTGLFGFILKLIALTLCLLTAFFPDIQYKVMNIEIDVFMFLAGITLSRAGLWIADLAINQLIQTETNNPPVIGGVQNSINILFELAKFTLVMWMPNLSQFWILILFSYVSVASGLLLYSYYMQKLNQKKRD